MDPNNTYISIINSNNIICTSYVPSTLSLSVNTKGIITSLCHGMAILPLLHCSLLLMVVVTGNWSDQLMARVMHS